MVDALKLLRRALEHRGAASIGVSPAPHDYIGRYWLRQLDYYGRENAIMRRTNVIRVSTVVDDPGLSGYGKEYFVPGIDTPGDPTKVIP